MQFQVPQFIDTEDRVVGPLTLRQFGYLAVAAVIIFALFFTVQNFAFYISAALVGGAGLAFAFVKVGGQSLAKVVVAAIKYFWGHQQYVWQPQVKPIKTEGARPKTASEGFSLEKIVAGMALKSAWQTVTTGSKAPERKEPPPLKGDGYYQIFHGITGEARVARRVDYR